MLKNSILEISLVGGDIPILNIAIGIYFLIFNIGVLMQEQYLRFVPQKNTFYDIPGYEGKYQIDTSGNVKSLSRMIFNGTRNVIKFKLSKEKI